MVPPGEAEQPQANFPFWALGCLSGPRLPFWASVCLSGKWACCPADVEGLSLSEAGNEMGVLWDPFCFSSWANQIISPNSF